MKELTDTNHAMIRKLTGIVLNNLENENFGVNELAMKSVIKWDLTARFILTGVFTRTLTIANETKQSDSRPRCKETKAFHQARLVKGFHFIYN
jgi:hypothetical protein